MIAKAYIAAIGKLPVKFFISICDQNNIEHILMENEANIIDELHTCQPDILFIQASIVEENKTIITQIKEDEILGDIHVVLHAARSGGAEYSNTIGADMFLPVPFTSEQIESVLRNALDLPKNILLIGSKFNEESGLYKRLKEKEFILNIAFSGDDGFDLCEKIFPDLILYEHDDGADNFNTRIKYMPTLNHIPVIMLYPNSEDVEIIEHLFEIGAHNILFPEYDSDENLNSILEITSPPRKGRKQKALVVDDSPVIRNIISKMFKQLGFIVRTAINGKDGLEKSRSIMPDIITSDYDMPEMNGWQFCSALKKDPELNEIPVIMITTRKSDVDLKKGKLLGVSDYITKPFDINELQAIVTRVLYEYKRKKEKRELEKYVSKDAIKNVSDVIEGIKEKKPEDKFLTVLFTDIVSFSRKCERFDAAHIVELLNKYFDLMIDILLKNNAIVDKMIGDAIVARFDSGLGHGIDAYNAAKAALEMLEALKEFNLTSYEEVKIRIGINSGEVILGNIGSEKYRLDYTMIGDEVNIDQRLESKASEMGCLISETAYDLIRQKVVVGERKVLEVKGKTIPVLAYQLKALLPFDGNDGENNKASEEEEEDIEEL